MTEHDMMAEIERLKKRLSRERGARQEAENLAERETRTLYDRQRELELLHRITDAANGTNSISDAIQTTLDHICSYTGWPVGHVYFFNEELDLLTPGKIWHLDDPQRFETLRQVTEGFQFRRGIGMPGTVLETGEPVWIPDVYKATNFPRAEQTRNIGVKAAFAFPVLAGASVVAVLEFFSGESVEEKETWLKIAAQAGIQLGRIFERQRSAAQLEKAHLALVDVSRRAGMAEVATGVLHNVGNVLNSVSVSATVVADKLKRSKIANLRLAANMLREKNGHLAEFLTTDPKGKLLPEYIGKAADLVEKEQSDMIAETHALTENIEHIKSIVAMQQHYAKVSGLNENLSASELVGDALRMNAASIDRHRIELVREDDNAAPKVHVDRHKVLQILINLIRNAKHAMEDSPEKRMTVRVLVPNATHVRITFTDTGVGIPAENLNRIFNHGFTTKEQGHGFGLHSGANAAKEMGGSLSAQSNGEGRGATFVLDLPVARAADSTDNA